MKSEITEILDKIKFNEAGLVPAVAQDFETGEVLMLAWMNKESIEKTLATKQIHYWSRSRNAMWRKGETSGHTQGLKEFLIDCDGDTILVIIEQVGPACHTGEHSCFFTKIEL
jgi:phosphoribosyl-AMP cyclohydrolase